jgi:hypothetical protein
LIGLASSVVQADVADGQPMMLGVNLAGSHAGCAPPVALVLPSPALLGLDLQGVFVDTVIQTDGLTKQWSQKLSVKFALVPGLTTERVPERETVNQQVIRGASGSVLRRRWLSIARSLWSDIRDSFSGTGLRGSRVLLGLRWA